MVSIKNMITSGAQICSDYVFTLIRHHKRQRSNMADSKTNMFIISQIRNATSSCLRWFHQEQKPSSETSQMKKKKKRLKPSFVGVDFSEGLPTLGGSEYIFPPFSSITAVTALKPIIQKAMSCIYTKPISSIRIRKRISPCPHRTKHPQGQSTTKNEGRPTKL